jgi:mRNA-degrading endonuclease RelE of RelBE toxin-antitoxin system
MTRSRQSAFCLLAITIILALDGCALLEKPTNRTLPALRMGKVIIPPANRTPITMILPAHNTQGTRIDKTRDWAPTTMPITPIRFLGIGGEPATTPGAIHNRLSTKTQPMVRREPVAQRVPGVPVLRVFFATNSAEVSAASRAALAKLRAGPTGYCLIGHADPRGASAYNLQLSTKRVLAVSNWVHGPVETEAVGELGANPKHSRYPFDRRVGVFRGHCQAPYLRTNTRARTHRTANLPAGAVLVGRSGNITVYRLKNGGYRTVVAPKERAGNPTIRKSPHHPRGAILVGHEEGNTLYRLRGGGYRTVPIPPPAAHQGRTPRSPLRGTQ